MELFLMRHADAEMRARDDFSRVLTEKGQRQTEKMAAWLKRLGVSPEKVVTSPYLRARETAELMARELSSPPPQVAEGLASGMTVASGCSLIHEHASPDSSLFLVGHTPDLDRLASHLLGAKDIVVEMRKAAVAHLEMTRSGFAGSVLRWLINPKL
ncbi:MAG: phosphohistidine phosphatase SixA [Planctomycetota bacterium]|jgi:phosphohistidine phosphatase|nr:phosphohistidine phosphatase SixA [Planctomycetota bacterium]